MARDGAYQEFQALGVFSSAPPCLKRVLEHTRLLLARAPAFNYGQVARTCGGFPPLVHAVEDSARRARFHPEVLESRREAGRAPHLLLEALNERMHDFSARNAHTLYQKPPVLPPLNHSIILVN